MIPAILDILEDHFARTGEWYALEFVMSAKIALGISLHREGWL